MVLLIFVGVWVAVLVPPALRARAEGHPGDSVGAFDRRLAILRRTGGFAASESARIASPHAQDVMRPVADARHVDVVRRRREVLVWLLAGMGATLVLGLLPPLRPLLLLHLLLDVVFAGYVALLVQLRTVAAQRDQKVRYLPNRVVMAAPGPTLRRVASK